MKSEAPYFYILIKIIYIHIQGYFWEHKFTDIGNSKHSNLCISSSKHIMQKIAVMPNHATV